jgi:hypothetical protein
MVAPDPSWLALLGPLPGSEGEWAQTTMTGAPFDGWLQVRLVLGDGGRTMRVVTATFDPEGRPGTVSDLVALAGGQRQETVGARVETDGSITGTHWLTENDRHTPRPLTATEQEGLQLLAGALRRRCNREDAG